MSSDLPIARFAVIEAADLTDAIDKFRTFPALLRMASSRCGYWDESRTGLDLIYFGRWC